MNTKIIAFICIVCFSLGTSFAQTTTSEADSFQFGNPEHFLDGYILNFQYQNGTAIHMEFYNGKAKYEWVSGSAKGRGNADIPYRSLKLGSDMYLVNWHEKGLSDYLTIVFDFDKMLIHSSIIIGYKNKAERPTKTVFLTGFIDHLDRKD
ncbi:MoaF C-terminal domain-containing protein [Formosa sp. L2A11]|uniref:MoaF C-terminal domain-containing protein n=1 Tax=Formosa sp. L2A11 TaxID=2686363 RepID=UPI00131E74C3|nr:MoaF C-terminal domain-containing protein [Formosa sp. L2A11]